MKKRNALSSSQTELKEALLRQVALIPKGQVSTYKLLTESLGLKCYRATGTLLGQNPELIKVPCHRIVLSSGKAGDYAKGTAEKIRLLKSEGILFNGEQIENFESLIFKFSPKHF